MTFRDQFSPADEAREDAEVDARERGESGWEEAIAPDADEDAAWERYVMQEDDWREPLDLYGGDAFIAYDA